MLSTFCTIITSNYIGYARAIEESLLRVDNKSLCIFISEWKCNLSNSYITENSHNCYYLDDLCSEGQAGRELYSKYYKHHITEFRWAMKGVFVNFLLKQYDKVIFGDPDLYFFNSTKFLWDLLDDYNLLLTPHWRNINVKANSRNEIANFDLLQTGGLFNAGFFAANKGAIPALTWVSDACLYKCEINPEQGLYGDQTYFNVLPVCFEKVHILKHQGCNIASWNITHCQRIKVDNRVLINNKYPIIFIHFTKNTIFDILNGKDGNLITYLDEYLTAIAKHGIPRNFRKELSSYNERPDKKIKRKLKPFLVKMFPNWKQLQ